MSRIRANTIVNGAGTGAPNFPRGAIISGISTINAEISVGTGTSISSPATNTLALGTNDVERLRIDSGGNVGINTDVTTNRSLTVFNTNSIIEIKSPGNTAGEYTQLYFSNPGPTNQPPASIWRNSSSNAGYGGTGSLNVYQGADAPITFMTGGTTERVRIQSTGIKFPAGNGIDFSSSEGSDATSSLLDDYEEGTFLPTMYGSTVAGSTTYSLQYGYYVKVGKLVHFQIRMTVTTSTATGFMYIGGLPFVALNDTDRGYASVNVSYANNITLPSGSTWMGAYTSAGGSHLVLIGNIPGSIIQTVSVDTSWTALIGGTYIANV